MQSSANILRVVRGIQGTSLTPWIAISSANLTSSMQNRGVGIFITHLRPSVQKTFMKAGIYTLLGFDAFRENVADAMAIVEGERTRESSFVLGSHSG